MDILLVNRAASKLQIFEAKSRAVKETPFEKPDVLHYTLISLNDHVISLGRDKSVHKLKISEAESATWERLADMIEEHGWLPHVAVSSGCIYVIGGQWLFNYCAVERYDPARNEWRRLQDKPDSIHESAVVTSGRYIYCFGGFQLGTYVSDVTRLDTETSQWQILNKMNEVKGLVSAAELDHVIYVAGGQIKGSFIMSLERYNPAVNQWTTLSPMNVGRSSFRLHAVDGHLYAVGGRRSPAFCTIEEYDIEKDEWNIALRDENMNIYDSVPILFL